MYWYNIYSKYSKVADYYYWPNFVQPNKRKVGHQQQELSMNKPTGTFIHRWIVYLWTRTTKQCTGLIQCFICPTLWTINKYLHIRRYIKIQQEDTKPNTIQIISDLLFLKHLKMTPSGKIAVFIIIILLIYYLFYWNNSFFQCQMMNI